MPAAPSNLPFAYIAGDPALDLVNTVDWTSSGPAEDRLTDHGALVRWAVGAGVLSPALAIRLRAAAARRPREAAAAVGKARRLRETLQRVFTAVAAAERPEAAGVADFNALLSEAVRRLRLSPSPVGAAWLRGPASASAGAMHWAWEDAEERLAAPLWPVAWAAAALLASKEAERIRVCGGPDCGWMYVDRSRNGLRRWCQMETCGTREKSRRRAVRQR